MRKYKPIVRRVPEPDSIYKSVHVAKFINFIMLNGEKAKAAKIVYKLLDLIKKEMHFDDTQLLDYFISTIEKVMLDNEIRKVKLGGASYQIPVESWEYRKFNLAIRLLIKNARILSRSSFVKGKKVRSGEKMHLSLFKEFKNINKGIGGTVKFKEQVNKIVEVNKQFAHLFKRVNKKKIRKLLTEKKVNKTRNYRTNYERTSNN